MNNKERLESIKKKFSAQRSVNARTYESLDLYDLSYEEGDWLIEQAEKVEQLQQEIAALKEALNESVKTSVALDNELQQEQAKTERYEKALREIANEQEVGEGDFNAADVTNNLIATAKEALEGGDLNGVKDI